jgi:hypothetical protein
MTSFFYQKLGGKFGKGLGLKKKGGGGGNGLLKNKA